ncbi:MAG: hypothetical protein Q9181_005795 [Wetmoreana brouardii]
MPDFPEDLQLQRFLRNEPRTDGGTYQGKSVVVESYSTDQLLDPIEGLRDVYGILKPVEPFGMHILPAVAHYHSQRRGDWQCGLISSAPPGMEIYGGVASFAGCIQYSTNVDCIAHALNQRFALAAKIATAVLYVHKSLRSNTVLMFERADARSSRKFPNALGEPFLSGFMYARPNHAGSWQAKNPLFPDEFDIYRHPDRRGHQPAARFSMCHDVYSLGVILLEIGLWRRAESAIQLQTSSPDRTPSPDCESSPEEPDKVLAKRAQNLKESLVNIAQSLRVNMGQKYQNVVMMCLNIGENEEIGSEKYIKRVLEKVEDLSLAMH